MSDEQRSEVERERQRIGEQAMAKLTGAHMVAMQALTLMKQVVERFGASGGMLACILVLTWLMGSATTKDDFIRAVLFGENSRWLQVTVIVLFLDFLFGAKVRKKWVDLRSSEVDRVAAERTKLQQKLLDRDSTRSDVGITVARETATTTPARETVQ